MSKKYDLICSLGGNCSAAHNLKIRGLRNFSLPFDWCYIKNEKPIEYLTEGFENGFKNFLLKKNLEELKGNEYNEAHVSCAQYKDSYTGYYFVNHFEKDKSLDDTYDFVYAKLRKRLNRLLEKIKQSQNILFLLSVNFGINIDSIMKLNSVLRDLYPDKNIEFICIAFNENKNEEIIYDNVKYKKYTRDVNVYDFINTNFEWAFLDDIQLRENKKRKKELFKAEKIKKGIKLKFLTMMTTILRVKIYIFGFRLDICVGKDRELWKN